MIVAYVCFPYRATTLEGVLRNKLEARAIAERINAIPGWRALVPHNLSEGIQSSLTEEQWLAFDIEMMKRSADVVVLHRERSCSSGCVDELREWGGPKIPEHDLETWAAHSAPRHFRKLLNPARAPR